jgi:ApaG protein
MTSSPASKTTPLIEVTVNTNYFDDDSDPQVDRYCFAYKIRIANTGTVGAKLLSRHWFIVDGHKHVEEVRGVGVVGEQPYLGPGETFEYTSFVILSTPVGNMFGTYEMIAEDGQIFMVEIKPFQLIKPNSLH